ncbi:uncharacterized protein LOC135202142 [Macrobrachium nipponense]|uniref:uncharacterized protein LOC135202142 n=1 Tax=Macrobrachium nipponense TaxID=159736 RepID=UPI0030C82209
MRRTPKNTRVSSDPVQHYDTAPPDCQQLIRSPTFPHPPSHPSTNLCQLSPPILQHSPVLTLTLTFSIFPPPLHRHLQFSPNPPAPSPFLQHLQLSSLHLSLPAPPHSSSNILHFHPPPTSPATPYSPLQHSPSSPYLSPNILQFPPHSSSNILQLSSTSPPTFSNSLPTNLSIPFT